MFNFTITPEQRRGIADKLRIELHDLDLDDTDIDYLVDTRLDSLIDEYIYG